MPSQQQQHPIFPHIVCKYTSISNTLIMYKAGWSFETKWLDEDSNAHYFWWSVTFPFTTMPFCQMEQIGQSPKCRERHNSGKIAYVDERSHMQQDEQCNRQHPPKPNWDVFRMTGYIPGSWIYKFLVPGFLHPGEERESDWHTKSTCQQKSHIELLFILSMNMHVNKTSK